MIFHRNKLIAYCGDGVIYLTLKQNFKRLTLFIWISASDTLFQVVLNIANVWFPTFANSSGVRWISHILLLAQLYLLVGMLRMRSYLYHHDIDQPD
jgi:hypothetical protein